MNHQQPEPVENVEETTFRAGFVALVGKPNVGKSTLLNTILAQKVAIVSWRPQTTRVPMRAILHRPDAQIVFIDTPGIHTPRHELGQFMVKLARKSIPDADVVCMMVDISTPPTELDTRIAEQVQRASAPRLLILNKIDLRPRGGTHLEAYRDLGRWDMELAVSARRGDGVESLVEELVARLPEGEPLYPEDWVVDCAVQDLAAEMVREKVLLFTQQEVPHAVAVEPEEWEEREGVTYIRMSINVERKNQKGILIGAGGQMLKRIGQAARQDIEQLIERPVYLDLWVKVRPNWRNDPSSLGWLGYRLKDYG
jgi:GTP-binding protein Era